MPLQQLDIFDVRNISELRWSLHPKWNIIHGENGSGKTALLESMYLLSTGKSFRCREILPLIQHEKEKFTVTGQLQNGSNLSIQKSISQATQVRIDGQNCVSSSELAHTLPCQILFHQLFSLIDGGSEFRRRILDWGLFYTKPEYMGVWKAYHKALQQRNALLRQKASLSHLKPWDLLLDQYSIPLMEYRQQYFTELETQFLKLLPQMLDMPISLEYYPGWTYASQSFFEVLQKQAAQDSQKQYTTVGPHRADIRIHFSGKEAKKFPSRGQQKMAMITLQLAQIYLLPQACLVLCDDIEAELDSKHLVRCIEVMDSIPGQYVVTTLSDRFSSMPLSEMPAQRMAIENGVLL
ncbi:MAG: DNA replication and repair protein RecF [Legionellaceae bacterium]|nr:DNA replication and repair protein RecF [Legionellaceae bacterium]